MRERGLKLCRAHICQEAVVVVPLAGTWIETPAAYCFPAALLSFPLRERGLKHDVTQPSVRKVIVVPLAGTWIETTAITSFLFMPWSFPLRERGLKQEEIQVGENITLSFPLRERGLKPFLRKPGQKPAAVVPFAGT